MSAPKMEDRPLLIEGRKNSGWTSSQLLQCVVNEQNTLDPRIFTDEDIYQLELEKVFGRCWMFLGHESQIPNQGDYITTYMGEDSVILARQNDMSFSAFLNMCCHRGMKICRAECGNAKAFTCTYHGWSYSTQGDLVHVPMLDKAYQNKLIKSDWGPPKVAQIDSYKGLIFATWDASAPSLDEYLGDMKWYMDNAFGRNSEGTEVIGGVHKWVLPSNWKYAAEQFADDMYHVDISHMSARAALIPEGATAASAEFPQEGTQFSSPQGHGTSFWSDADLFSLVIGQPAIDYVQGKGLETSIATLGKERVENISAMNATVFPNMSFLGCPASTVRVWHPKGPHETEIWSMVVVDKAAPDEVKEGWRKAIINTFSTTGMFEQDDAENWSEIQRVFRGYRARQTKLNAEMGAGNAVEDHPIFPGRTNNGYSEEGARGLYRRWAHLIIGDSWEDVNNLSGIK